jgi:hypothetical protein
MAMSSKEKYDLAGVCIYALMIFAFAILCGVFWIQGQLFLSGLSGFMVIKEGRGFWKMLHMEDD